MQKTAAGKSSKIAVPTIVDIEASGFGSESFPIEVGLALSDETRYCALIAPDPEWRHWDAEAEALHGISREFIEENGKTPEEIAIELNMLLRGTTIYSDGWTVDYPWLRTLFQAAREEMAFSVSSLEMLMTEVDLLNWDATKARILRKRNIDRHRASIDAMVIQETYLKVKTLGRP